MMRSKPETSGRAVSRQWLFWAGVALSLSLLVHFSADLTWMVRHATAPEAAQTASTQPTGDSERTALADPNNAAGALLPLAWSVPFGSCLVVAVILVLRDRALPRLPLLHPPAFS